MSKVREGAGLRMHPYWKASKPVTDQQYAKRSAQGTGRTPGGELRYSGTWGM